MLQVHYILDRPSDRWDGLKGYVTEDVVKVNPGRAGRLQCAHRGGRGRCGTL